MNNTSQFETELFSPAQAEEEPPWAFVVLPKGVSETLPRRGRTTVNVTLNGQAFQATLEPDGQLSHWLKLSTELLAAADVQAGDVVMFTVTPVDQEPEPEVPADLQEALDAVPEAQAVWGATTTVARVDWVHWIVTAKQAKTRAKRIHDACDMLASGKRRVCCFDPSGYYSKALSAPKTPPRGF